jgi:hypothetical protein
MRTLAQPTVATFGDPRYGPQVSDLTRVPLSIDPEWQSKTVTTNPPSYTPHLEWALTFTMTAAQPLRLAVLVEAPSRIAWGLVAQDPSTKARATAKFFPYDWAKSDEVQVNFEFQRASVADPRLKQDPRQAVSVVAPRRAETGSRIPVAALPSHGLTLAVIAFAERDTERSREERWRLKPVFAEAVERHGAALASGRQRGTMPG